MKERGIIFSAQEVRSLLDGTKTQMRRICKAWKNHDDGDEYRDTDGWPLRDCSVDGCGDVRIASPYGVPGDQLWARESWQAWTEFNKLPPSAIPSDSRVNYLADGNVWDSKRRAGTFMPRWASRITLEVIGVRVERLWAISEADARAEGISDAGCTACGRPEPCGCLTPSPDARDAYIWIWESVNGAGLWDANPHVWVVGFRRV